MSKERLEAFSDGVIAILITLMVFNIKAPHEADFAALLSTASSILTYLLSFIYLGIYWNNHHHMLRLTKNVTGRVLWANLHLLFWLALIPFGTTWMRETRFAPLPTAVYGVVLMMCSMAWLLLQTYLIMHERNAALAAAVGRDIKGKVSAALYTIAIFAAFARPWIALSLYVLVAGMWLIPDRRFEAAANKADSTPHV